MRCTKTMRILEIMRLCELGLSHSEIAASVCEKTDKGVTMIQNHEPGRELYIDWVGDTLDCVTDPYTGELLTAHFFVPAMGCSCYPYVEAFPSEVEAHWLTGHVSCLPAAALHERPAWGRAFMERGIRDIDLLSALRMKRFF